MTVVSVALTVVAVDESVCCTVVVVSVCTVVSEPVTVVVVAVSVGVESVCC